MYKTSRIPLIIAALLISSPSWAASLEDARQLYEGGRAEEALAAIESILGSDAADGDKAAALDLLGTIAVDKGQLPMAKHAWSRLLDEYPDYAAANDTGTKLSLVSALLKTEAPPAPSAPTAAPPAAAISPPPPTPKAAEVAPTREASPTSPSATAAPAPPAAPSPDSTGLVLVAARGKPHDAARELSDRIITFLRQRGVDAASATGGIPVVADSKMVLPLLLQKGEQETAESVLLLTADFVSMQKVALDCYTPGGAKLWKVKTSGGTGWKGRPYTKSGITEQLAARFLEKLEGKIGQPGLPVTLD